MHAARSSYRGSRRDPALSTSSPAPVRACSCSRSLAYPMLSICAPSVAFFGYRREKDAPGPLCRISVVTAPRSLAIRGASDLASARCLVARGAGRRNEEHRDLPRSATRAFQPFAEDGEGEVSTARPEQGRQIQVGIMGARADRLHARPIAEGTRAPSPPGRGPHPTSQPSRPP